MIDIAHKQWIDDATYEQLLYRWRHAPSTDLMFQDKDAGNYFAKIMREKRCDHVATSKRVGWLND